MRIFALLILAFFVSCSDRQTKEIPVNENPKPSLSVIQASFPLRLHEINLEEATNTVQVNDGIVLKLEETFQEYTKSIEFSDSSQNIKDLYINTLQLQDSLHTLFVMLLKAYPTGELNSKVLFYDNQKKAFIGEALDFKLYALYDLLDGTLIPTTLKKDFNITSPEIESLDFNKDGKNDYQFKRLWHNGTFNAMHTTILTVNNSTSDTLYFCEKGLGELAGKKSCL
ncbi:MAG: hypothetical protein K0R51_2463 [Cytophagaceae bacterium]|jgi:hypothetical protein|nr:hypothetical protein [Cytophagaceae bacterium]